MAQPPLGQAAVITAAQAGPTPVSGSLVYSRNPFPRQNTPKATRSRFPVPCVDLIDTENVDVLASPHTHSSVAPVTQTILQSTGLARAY
jgi:hypothetical protein